MYQRYNMKKKLKKIFMVKVEGIGVVEIILILVILVSLVLIFKDQITGIIEKAFQSITGDSTSIIG